VLTTLLDPGAFPAREIAARYAERWQVETAFLHLKKTVRGTGRTLRGRSAVLARQEAWALLLVHNMIAALAARTAAAAADPLALLTAAITAQPLNRENRRRTSGRTTAGRRKWPTEEATYDITIVPSNPPKADACPRT
jgi:DDE family transposase